MGDGALLDCFVSRGGEPAELAFATIVERHGPLVMRVCRQVLRDQDEADDAFQATFLTLARSANSIRKRDSLASWLHGTALRVSACSRTASARRKRHESRFAALRVWRQADNAVTPDDQSAVLHEEVGKLPARFRTALVLCDLEGLSHDEAAKQLGWPIGTIKSRIFRGRERLKSRLIRRGLAPALLGAISAGDAAAGIRPSLIAATVRIAMGQSAQGTAPTVVLLADLFQRSMFMIRIRTTLAGLMLVSLIAGGSGLLAQQSQKDTRNENQPGGAVPVGPRTIVKTYAIGDLLMDMVPVGNQKRHPVDVVPLMTLLSKSVAPGTWQMIGKNDQGDEYLERMEKQPELIGEMRFFSLSLSLIVRHSPAVHKEFEERLSQLRDLVNARTPGGKAEAQAPGGMMGMSGGAAGMGMGAVPSGKPGVPGSSGMMGGMAGGSQGKGPGVMGAGPGSSIGVAPDNSMGMMMRRMGGVTPQAKGVDRRSGDRPPVAGMPGMGSMMGSGGSGSGGMMVAQDPATPIDPKPVRDDTQQRLQAVEEKLDRILKALDGAKSGK
jgi:RNA polymerase sigma factor (sigma-70 family)